MSVPTVPDAINTLTGVWRNVGALIVVFTAMFLLVHNYAVDDYLRVLAERNHERLITLHCVGGRGAPPRTTSQSSVHGRGRLRPPPTDTRYDLFP